MSNQHSALLLAAPGAPYEVGTRTTPTPGPGQVLVRNKAVALNPVDNFMQKTGFFISAGGFPTVTGSDGAGEIAAVGPNVANWEVDDKVFYQCWFIPDRGTFQEYTIADAERVARVPANVSFEQIVTAPLGLATAAVGLYRPRLPDTGPTGNSVGGAGLTPPWEAGGQGKYTGQAILVVGGSSSVGQFTLQLAKLSGFSTIITTASKHNEAYCKSAGATHVIDYHAVPYSQLHESVGEILGGQKLSYVYDAISVTESQEAGWKLLAPGGAMAVVLPPSPNVGKPSQDDEQGRHLVYVYGAANDPVNYEFATGLYSAVTELFEKGALKPNQVEHIGHGLEVITTGLKKLENGVSGVKLVASL